MSNLKNYKFCKICGKGFYTDSEEQSTAANWIQVCHKPCLHVF